MRGHSPPKQLLQYTLPHNPGNRPPILCTEVVNGLTPGQRPPPGLAMPQSRYKGRMPDGLSTHQSAAADSCQMQPPSLNPHVVHVRETGDVAK